jgi:murein L,D-transpeptidase YafK
MDELRNLVKNMTGPMMKEMADSMLISFWSGLKVDYQNARGTDDAERMKFCEDMLKKVEDELASRANKE